MANLPTRSLGKDGPQVTSLGFGLMGLSVLYGTKLPDEDRLRLLDYACDSEMTFWDTSDFYGDNELLLGQWFKKSGKRNKIFLATKFGGTIGPDGALVVRNEPEYVRQACDKSFQRLDLAEGDSIDLYYCHRIDPKQPIESTVKAMVELKKAGKIKYLGLSECSAETLRRACKVHHIAAVQVEYSPFALDIENNDLLKTCRELGVAVVAYSPLSRGFLTGSIKSRDDLEEDDRRRALPRFSEENFPKNLELVNTIARLAEKRGVTPGQLTLAWVMAQGADIIPIPGTTKVKNFDENIASLRIELTQEEKAEMRESLEAAEVAGDRYPNALQANLYADTVPLK